MTGLPVPEPHLRASHSSPATTGPLTDSGYWDSFWEEARIPAELRNQGGRSIDAVLGVLARFISVPPDGLVLELGGAPGQFLAYIQRRLNCRVGILDLSPRGCELAIANMCLLGIDAEIVCGDLFTSEQFVGRCDAVYSLGLIEHFEDTTAIVRAHTRFLRPGGTLVVGLPNFDGVYRHALTWLRPMMMRHNRRAAMHLASWDAFESELGLVRLWRGYVGGFEPLVAARTELPGLLPRSVALLCRAAGFLLNRPRLTRLRRFNSRLWSTYLIGAYRIP